MVKDMQKYTVIGVIALCLPLVLVSKDFRAPLVVVNHGYDFDPREKAQWHTTFDADWYTRSADRSFAAHGIATGELSQLFFNKSSFRLSQIFEDCLVGQDTQYYNPFMRVITINPKVAYRESGLTLTAGFSRAAATGKGRFGVRLRLPIRAVDTIRKDDGSRRDSQTEDVVKRQKNPATADLGFAARLDFLEAIPNQQLTSSQVEYNYNGDNHIRVFAGDTRSQNAAAVYSPEGYIPRGSVVGVAQDSISNTALPVTLSGLQNDILYKFVTDAGYATLAETANNSVPVRVANQDKKATVWVVSAHNNTSAPSGIGDGDVVSGGASGNMATRLNDYLSTFNSNAYEWMHDRGYDFESSRQVGLGDLDVELYYDHEFGDRIIGGISALLKAPTACGSNAQENSFAGNPYRSHTGNGQHVELGGGLHFDVEARSWVMLRFDGEYRFALARTEKICGTPAGSLIKNIGSEQLADVSWHSVVANADMHFCHPQTTDLTGFIGYQFYWKRADTIRFNDLSVESWLGKKYKRSGPVAARDYTIENTIALDNALASANTEQFAHRIKGGMTYHLSDWCSLSAGGSITFAGQNMPKEMDVFAGCRVVL